jgi:biofilm PGA synthesis N-glycosyltransferase PgaC
MAIVFWSSCLFLVYVFFGYPLILAGLALVVRRPVQKRRIEPSVSLILAARNEADRIGHRIQNLLSLDYPKDKLQIIVVLDGPTDGTESVVRCLDQSQLELIHLPWPRGKAAAINAAVARATGDIIVFTDARQIFEPNAVRELVSNFADPRVGGATGELILESGSGDEPCAPTGVYWRYEKKIRSLESRIHSVVGATGAIYAVRRWLFEPLPDKTILDDVMIPMRIVLLGYRVIFDSAAKAYDSLSCCPAAEYARKVRTLAGNYELLAKIPGLTSPSTNPVFFQFVSHKIGRLIAPFALTTMFISNALLVYLPFYALLFAAQSAWYTCAVLGHVESLRQSSASIPVASDPRKAA